MTLGRRFCRHPPGSRLDNDMEGDAGDFVAQGGGSGALKRLDSSSYPEVYACTDTQSGQHLLISFSAPVQSPTPS